jgi:hypothetical protein
MHWAEQKRIIKKGVAAAAAVSRNVISFSLYFHFSSTRFNATPSFDAMGG